MDGLASYRMDNANFDNRTNMTVTETETPLTLLPPAKDVPSFNKCG